MASVFLFLGTGAQPNYGLAQDSGTAEQRLSDIEATIADSENRKQALEQDAQTFMSEAEQAKQKLITIAGDIQKAETLATQLEDRINSLESDIANKQSALDTRRGELVHLLAALERLTSRPAASALLQPGAALETARTTSLLGRMVPSIQEKASALKMELMALVVLQEDVSAQRFALKDTLVTLTDKRGELDALRVARLGESLKARRAAEIEQRRIMKLARQARNIKDLIAKLAQEAAKAEEEAARAAKLNNIPYPKPRPSVNMNRRKGALPYPVSGRLKTRFGAQDGSIKSRGIHITARRGGQVVAPYDGQIVFSGPFRDYGQLLIIAHSGGYHSLLAGLDTQYGVVGQWVLTGEPIGTMTKTKRDANLYMELRHNGQAINPLPWLQKTIATR